MVTGYNVTKISDYYTQNTCLCNVNAAIRRDCAKS